MRFAKSITAFTKSEKSYSLLMAGRGDRMSHLVRPRFNGPLEVQKA